MSNKFIKIEDDIFNIEELHSCFRKDDSYFFLVYNKSYRVKFSKYLVGSLLDFLKKLDWNSRFDYAVFDVDLHIARSEPCSEEGAAFIKRWEDTDNENEPKAQSGVDDTNLCQL